MTIGIPTLSRPNGSHYIEMTLDSLIRHTDVTERQDVTIVILLADESEESRLATNDKLLQRYAEHFQTGFIQTIGAPASFYPELDNLVHGPSYWFNHSAVRVKWRSKQNFDFAFLMTYSEPLSEYYLQLEDDVTTVPRYMKAIRAFMTTHSHWVSLEFSELGFIGKFFRSQTLRKLAKFLIMFYSDQPNDVLLMHFNEIQLQFLRFIRRPTLFQHQGIQSSLEGRKQELIDLYFDTPDSKSQPVAKRQKNGVNGPEIEVWEERLKRIKNRFCNM